MEVKRICQWCGKPFAQKTTTCYCSPQCSKRGYKHRIKERKMELRHMQEMQELRSSLEKQEYFTFSQAARLMGVSRQYIYKLVKEDTHLYTLMYPIIVQQKNDLFGSLFLCYRKIYCTFIIADIYALTVLPNSLVTWYGSVHVKPSMDVAIYPISPKAAN